MKVHRIFMSNEKWSGPVIEFEVDFCAIDDSVSEYRIMIADKSGHEIDITKLFTNNWPFFVEEILQETDWKNIYRNANN